MKKYNLTVILLSFIIIIVLGSGFFYILFNNSYNIKIDFTNAFNYRITGNCLAFQKYLYVDISATSSLYNNCLDEKNRTNKTIPIKEFRILNISVSDRVAYLQVELNRKEKYTANYEMKKIDNTWKIKSK